MNTLDLAYIAGFFDGEGSVTIHENCRPSPRGHAPNHTLQVSIGNTDPRVIKWIHETYGGTYAVRARTVSNHRVCGQWIARANIALKFLEDIRPHLRMKGDRADIGICFQRSKTKSPGRHGPGSNLSKEEISWREEQRVKIRVENARERHH